MKFYFFLDREAALIKQATSMYSMPIGPVKSTIRYPFVFDASLDAKNSSSFIAGNKVTPKIFRRKDITLTRNRVIRICI